MKSKVKRIKTFILFPKGQSSDREYQAILWPSGKVFVGMDVWRILNPHDIQEYEITKYSSLEECLEEYEIKKRFESYYKEA